jgi:NADH:ubiquinone oxidoreductase subunit F (NADH-binding)
MAERRTRPTDAVDLLELAQVMTDTSICGLGQAASWAIVDAQKRWPEMFA